MLWIKALHIIFVITWFAGLFYLPRLFVYHAMTAETDTISLERFKIMERKLYYGIMMPGAIFSLIFGLWLLSYNMQGYMHSGWMHAKLALVAILIAYHLYLGYLVKCFKNNANKHGHVFYRVLNEVPVFILLGIVVLVVVKPI